MAPEETASMSYSLDEIRTLLAVTQHGSISATATRLGLTKSVVSQRIRRLEDTLGIGLLHRSSRGIALTDRGATFVAEVQDALDLLDQAALRASADDAQLRGRLRVSVPMSFGTCYLGPVMCRFLWDHPALELQLDLNDRQVDLAREGYDLAIRITQLPDDAPLVARRLGISRRVVCASPDYLGAHEAPKTLAALSQHALIGYAHPVPGLWRFVGDSGPQVRPEHGRITANNGEAMRDAAVAGLGIAVLPLFIVADDLRSGRLHPCLPEHAPVPDTIYAVYPPRRHPMRTVARLVEHLRTALGATPPWEQDLPEAMSGHAAFANAEREGSPN